MAIAFIEGIVAFIIGTFIIFLSEDIAYVVVMVIIIGILIAYISSWLLYGYGELIEKNVRNLQGVEHRCCFPHTSHKT